ncbi:glycosyltransferase family 39 protein [Candidatus Gottesmanbacteria bacterium]|nr:glycosyltransferase family 39 protein [Candidatus Gottesmanbacteria bacterium]
MLNWLITHSPLLYFTQSLWRDEAFSILAAQQPLVQLLPKLSFEPPVYYILLHFWMKIFNQSELATRSLSLLGFALATVVVIVWAEKLFKYHWLRWFAPLFFFLNPMLIYYAFEVRTYGWYIFFATLTMYAYWKESWVLFLASATLGFYTHSYFGVVPLVAAVHWLIIHKKKLLHPLALAKEPFVHSLVLFSLLASPWLAKISRDLGTLKQSWYFPVNVNLVKSVLGNMFIGYEGTPWFLWGATQLLSLILVIFFLFALGRKSTRQRNFFFFLMVFLPLTIVIGVSFIKPLFVNRYLIAVTIAEVMLLLFALEAIKKESVKKAIAFFLLTCTFLVNIWYPALHAKLDIRSTIKEVNAMVKPTDIILAESSLIFLETRYYAKNRNQVFFYDPNDTGFPWYVGSAAFSNAYLVHKLPIYPARAFLISENGTYRVVFRTVLPSKRASKL